MTGECNAVAFDLNLVPVARPAAQNDAAGASTLDAMAVRAADVIVATLALLVLAPVLASLCLAIWLQDGGAPIFVHRRVGRGGAPFPCLKLRTMVTDSEHRLRTLLETDEAAAQEWAVGQKLANDPRVTRLGRFLRKSSLDEIPQLFNVLVGHMSIVGPRPIVPAEVPRYGRYIQGYYRVRPGITGLWQVSGRSAVTYRRRVALDTLYVRRQSLAMNLAILGMTVPAVIAGRGSS